MNREYLFLSCEAAFRGGGIYLFAFNGSYLTLEKYVPCDEPMYVAWYGAKLVVLLKEPFKPSNPESGYILLDEELHILEGPYSTFGLEACHVASSQDSIYVANFSSGSICELLKEQILVHTGHGVHPARQDLPHPHMIQPNRAGDLVLVADLGLDTLFVYSKDFFLKAKAQVPLGYGIRHLVLSRDEQTIYSVNEIVPSITRFTWDKRTLTAHETTLLPCSLVGHGAAIRLSSCGKYLVSSVREENACYVHEIQADGALHLLQKRDAEGAWPRDIWLDEDFLIVTNEKSDSISVFQMKEGKIGALVWKQNLPKVLCCIPMGRH